MKRYLALAVLLGGVVLLIPFGAGGTPPDAEVNSADAPDGPDTPGTQDSNERPSDETFEGRRCYCVVAINEMGCVCVVCDWFDNRPSAPWIPYENASDCAGDCTCGDTGNGDRPRAGSPQPETDPGASALSASTELYFVGTSDGERVYIGPLTVDELLIVAMESGVVVDGEVTDIPDDRQIAFAPIPYYTGSDVRAQADEAVGGPDSGVGHTCCRLACSGWGCICVDCIQVPPGAECPPGYIDGEDCPDGGGGGTPAPYPNGTP